MGSKYLEYTPGSELNIFSHEQWTMNKIIEWNKSRTKDEWIIKQQQNRLNNNNITGTSALCTT